MPGRPKPNPAPAPGQGEQPKVEVTATLLEALLRSKAKSMEPMAEMLAGFYTSLIKHGMPETLAAASALKLLDGLVTQLLVGKIMDSAATSPRPTTNTDTTDRERGDDLDDY